MIQKFFDSYSLKARMLPAAVCVCPAVITLLSLMPTEITAPTTSVFGFMSIALLFLLANWVRSKGKKIQQNLFSLWGGSPTTVILRHSDNTLDEGVKRRYKGFLAHKISDVVMPSKNAEEQNPSFADEQYKNATQWLISNTRQTPIFPLVHAENINYGFRRNMLGIRNFCVHAIQPVLMANIVGAYWYWLRPDLDVPTLAVFSIFLNTALFAYWIFVVNEKWVKEVAFEYAKQLMQTCDWLESQQQT